MYFMNAKWLAADYDSNDCRPWTGHYNVRSPCTRILHKFCQLAICPINYDAFTWLKNILLYRFCYHSAAIHVTHIIFMDFSRISYFYIFQFSTIFVYLFFVCDITYNVKCICSHSGIRFKIRDYIIINNNDKSCSKKPNKKCHFCHRFQKLKCIKFRYLWRS